MHGWVGRRSFSGARFQGNQGTSIMMKILTIGGGIGGLTTTLALQRQGFDAHVYESAAEVQPVGKGIWVPTNAMLVLERFGLSNAVVRSGVPLARIEVRD